MTALREANARILAGNFSHQLIRSDSTQHALRTAFQAQAAEDNLQRWEDIRDVAIQFAAVDIPVMIGTFLLTEGIGTAAYLSWRVATGIRIGARVLRAAEFAASIPINMAIESAVTGQPLDLSASSLLTHAGSMLGTQIGFRVAGRISQRAFATLRERIPAALQRLTVQGPFIGGRTGVGATSHLRDVENLTAARLQSPKKATCGIFAAISAIEDLPQRNQFIDFRGIRAKIRENGGRGLSELELAAFIERQFPPVSIAGIPLRGVTEDVLLDQLSRGRRIIAGVHGNHWVRVVGTVSRNGSDWVRIYDPAVGNYDQLLTSFMTRTIPSNGIMVAISGGS